MNKITNLIFFFFSILPTLILPVVYKKLVENPNTKISGNGGFILTKLEFVGYIIFFSILGYIISLIVSKNNNNIISSTLPPFVVRIIINGGVTIFLIVLIFSNLMK
jgi:hypothetical protein